MSRASTAFENEILTCAKIYEERGILSLEKVDPPSFTVDKGFGKLKPNPFLDFVGVWTERSGQMIMLEAKTTKTRRLPFRRHGGLTQKQIENLFRWESRGAAVGVLWLHKGRCVFVSTYALSVADNEKSKSLSHDLLDAGVPIGKGFLFYDFVQNLRNCY